MNQNSIKKTLSQIGMYFSSFGLSALYIVGGLLALYEAYRLQVQTNYSNFFAGPSGYMSIMGVILVILFVPELKQGLKRFEQKKIKAVEQAANSQKELTPEEQEKRNEEKNNIKRMWVTFAMLVMYALLIQPLGFMIATILFLVANMLYLGNSIKTTVITVLVITVFLYFAPQLGLSLPQGIFGI